MSKVKWKNIPNYEGIYQVSNEGQVRSLGRLSDHAYCGVRMLSGKVLRAAINSGGYQTVKLSKNGKQKTFKVSRLVVIAFIGEPEIGHDIDHIDGVKSNDSIKNLQVLTHRENTAKGKVGGTSRHYGVSWNNRFGRWVSQIQINKKVIHLGYFDTETDASEAYQNRVKQLNK